VSDLERRNESRNVRRSDEDSNCGPYVLIALALAFAGFGMSIGLTSGMLVSVFLLVFPALILLALGISKLQEKKQMSVPRSSARSGNSFLLSGTMAAANPNRGRDGGLAHRALGRRDALRARRRGAPRGRGPQRGAVLAASGPEQPGDREPGVARTLPPGEPRLALLEERGEAVPVVLRVPAEGLAFGLTF
jgi:hypothetical protein